MEMEIFNKTIPLYGIFFFLGIIIAGGLSILFAKKKKIDMFDFICAVVYVMIGAIAGAKLLFIIVSWREIMELALTFEQILKGGFIFYGGLLGGFLGLLLYGKQFKTKIVCYLDIFATVLPLGHAFGRIGCFFAGCCYGMPYDGIGSVTYKSSFTLQTPIGIRLLPIQLIESSCLFVLFIGLLILFLKGKKQGINCTVYLLAYSFLRFILEFFRGDKERGILLGLSTSQWISIFIFIATIIMYWRKKSNESKN